MEEQRISELIYISVPGACGPPGISIGAITGDALVSKGVRHQRSHETSWTPYSRQSATRGDRRLRLRTQMSALSTKARWALGGAVGYDELA